MFCKQCGKELADYMCFCPRCGTPAPSAKLIKQATLAVAQTTGKNGVTTTDIEEEKNQPEKESGKQVKQRKKVIIACVLAAVIVLTALIGVFFVPMLPLHGNRKSHVLKAELQNVVTPEDNNTIVKFIDEIMPLFAETIKKTNSQTATEQDYMNVIDFCIEKKNTVNTVLDRIADSCTNYETNDSSESTIVFIGAQLNLASLGPKAALFQLKNPPPNHNTENDVEEAFYAIAKFVNEISDVLYGESIFEDYNIDIDFEGAPSNQDTMAADSSEVPIVSETAVSEAVSEKAVSETKSLETEPSTTAPSSSNDTGAMSLRGYCLTTDALNVRTGPGTGYSIIKVLPANAEVYVTGTGKSSDGKTWASIEGGGYVCTDYLVREENAGGYYQTTDALNVRTGPGTGYSVIKLLPARTRVRVMSTETGSDGRIWARIESGGYVCTDYLAPEGTGY